MNVLVAGGAGFVGGHLVEGLVAQGHCVTVVDDLSNGSLENLRDSMSQIAFFEADVAEPPSTWFGSLKPTFDAIYNLACWPRSRSFANPKRDVEVNVVGMVHAIEVARQSSARLIFSSNSGIYDTERVPISEATRDAPKTPYDLDKLSAEKYLELYADTFGLEYVIFRFATVYGPRQRVTDEWKPVVVEFIDKLKRGEPPTIYWNGDQTRDLVFVKDIVDALIRSLDTPGAVGQRVLLGTGVETSMNRLYDEVSSQLGTSIEPIRKPMVLGDIGRMCYDCTRAEEALGWRASTTLSEGVAEVIKSLE